MAAGVAMYTRSSGGLIVMSSHRFKNMVTSRLGQFAVGHCSSVPRALGKLDRAYDAILKGFRWG